MAFKASEFHTIALRGEKKISEEGKAHNWAQESFNVCWLAG